MITLEHTDVLARRENTLGIPCNLDLGLEYLLERLWESLGLVRVFTKKKGRAPDFGEPLVLTDGRGGTTVESACNQLHKDLAANFKFAMVWGTSTKYNPQRVGLRHRLEDEDVLQIVIKTAEEQRHDKSYSDKVQNYYDSKKKKNKQKS